MAGSWNQGNLYKKIVIGAGGLIVIYSFLIIVQNFFGYSNTSLRVSENSGYSRVNSQSGISAPTSSINNSKSDLAYMLPEYDEYAPVTGSNRMVVTDSTMSLAVKEVPTAVEQVIAITQQADGYMVSRKINRPQESPFATVILRVPSSQIDQILTQFRAVAIDVVSEEINGRDVTDEYFDIQTRLTTLQKTKTIFEGLLDQATNFDQILRAKQEILQIQNEIDSLLGRQNLLEETARLARVTLYISSDELSLPYAPGENWRPELTIKLAVRSPIPPLRDLADILIWLVIYGVIWIPISLIIFIFFKRRQISHKSPPSTQIH